MTSKKFYDDKVLRVFLYVEVIGGILTAHGIQANMLGWVMRGISVVAVIALTLLINSRYPSKGQLITVCAGLILEYGLQAWVTYQSAARVFLLPCITLQAKLVVLRFALFIIIIIAQCVVYFSYVGDSKFFQKLQGLVCTKIWMVVSLVLIATYFTVFWSYLAHGMYLYSQEKGNLEQTLGSYAYVWIQDLISRGIGFYAYFRSITWHKHVGKGASPEE